MDHGGKQQWKAGGGVYVGSADGHLYALDLKSGKELWQYDSGIPITSAPAVTGNMLIITDWDANTYAFVAPGKTESLAGTCRDAVRLSGDTAEAKALTSWHARQVVPFLLRATLKQARTVFDSRGGGRYIASETK